MRNQIPAEFFQALIDKLIGREAGLFIRGMHLVVVHHEHHRRGIVLLQLFSYLVRYQVRPWAIDGLVKRMNKNEYLRIRKSPTCCRGCSRLLGSIRWFPDRSADSRGRPGRELPRDWARDLARSGRAECSRRSWFLVWCRLCLRGAGRYTKSAGIWPGARIACSRPACSVKFPFWIFLKG